MTFNCYKNLSAHFVPTRRRLSLIWCCWSFFLDQLVWSIEILMKFKFSCKIFDKPTQFLSKLVIRCTNCTIIKFQINKDSHDFLRNDHSILKLLRVRSSHQDDSSICLTMTNKSKCEKKNLKHYSTCTCIIQWPELSRLVFSTTVWYNATQKFFMIHFKHSSIFINYF